MTVISYLTEPAVIARILGHLGLPATAPPIAPARRREDDAHQFEPDPTTDDGFWGA